MRNSVFAAFAFLIAFNAVADGSYVINRDASKVEFLALGKPSMLKIRGIDAKPTGTFIVKDLKLSGSVSISLNEFTTGMDTRNKHMKEKYLETQKYPDSVLILDPIALSKNLTVRDIPFTGKLKMHGEEKPVSGILNVLEVNKTDLSTSGSFKIKTSDFKIATPSFAGVTMAEEVEVEFKASAKNTP